jgi:group II intron reverse transcriptase/maturase
MSFKPTMHGPQKSDGLVVPTKSSNKAATAAAETMEGRSPAKGNTNQQNALRTQSREVRAPSALDRVREVARTDKGAKFTALLHHVTEERLRSAFFELKKKAAPGIDGVTWDSYSVRLDERIADLHGRVHRGAYRASPSRRVFIPKSDGTKRPLGIASLEDKIVQRAVADVMNAVYEEDFLGFSYGFRAGRSQHDALDALATGIIRKKVNYVLDADIRGYFDSIDHGWLVKFIEHRISDRRLLRLLQKWLAAGVIDHGAWSETLQGSPQGATISPLLANVFLHYVFDLWVQQWRKRRARGDMVVVRYADDTAVGFQYHADAVQFLAELRERMRKFSLELHPEKTRLIAFGRYAAARRQEQSLRGAPETFAFLGFTHICARTRSGKFLLVRRTVRKRMSATLRRVRDELMRRRHLSVPEQGRWLGAVVRGYFAYHAVPTNGRSLAVFQKEVERRWLFALRRRSQRSRLTWERMQRLSDRWIPSPKILHPWPEERFDAKTRGRSRVR